MEKLSQSYLRMSSISPMVAVVGNCHENPCCISYHLYRALSLFQKVPPLFTRSRTHHHHTIITSSLPSSSPSSSHHRHHHHYHHIIITIIHKQLSHHHHLHYNLMSNGLCTVYTYTPPSHPIIGVMRL